MQKFKRFIKADNGKVAEGIEYESGKRVEIPINKDGSVKWFDDNKLLKNGGANHGRYNDKHLFRGCRTRCRVSRSPHSNKCYFKKTS